MTDCIPSTERREGDVLMYSGSGSDYGERRDPSEYPSQSGYDYNYVQPEVMPESFVPDLPYYKLPAGLMVPVVKVLHPSPFVIAVFAYTSK